MQRVSALGLRTGSQSKQKLSTQELKAFILVGAFATSGDTNRQFAYWAFKVLILGAFDMCTILLSRTQHGGFSTSALILRVCRIFLDIVSFNRMATVALSVPHGDTCKVAIYWSRQGHSEGI